MSRLSRARMALTASVTVVSIAACGVPLQERPVELEIRTAPTETPPPSDGPLSLTIYLIRDGRLHGVSRQTDETSLGAAVARLVEGPTASEADAGLTTALLSQSFSVDRVEDIISGTGTVTVGATDDFTEVSGDDQRLATAQLVWTVTENEPFDRVRVTLGGTALRLPTDVGNGGYAVTRTDYRSIAPLPSPTQSAFTQLQTTQ